MSGDFPFASRIQEFSNVFHVFSEFLGVSAFRTIPRVSRSWNRHLGSLLKTQIVTRRFQNRCELRAKNAFERNLPDHLKSGDGGRSPYSNRCIIYHAEMDLLVSAEDILPGDWVVIRERSGNQRTATADLTLESITIGSHCHVDRFFYLGFHMNEKDALQRGAESLMVTITRSEPVRKTWEWEWRDATREQLVTLRPHFPRWTALERIPVDPSHDSL